MRQNFTFVKKHIVKLAKIEIKASEDKGHINISTRYLSTTT